MGAGGHRRGDKPNQLRTGWRGEGGEKTVGQGRQGSERGTGWHHVTVLYSHLLAGRDTEPQNWPWKLVIDFKTVRCHLAQHC